MCDPLITSHLFVTQHALGKMVVYGQNVTRELNIEYLYIHEIKIFKSLTLYQQVHKGERKPKLLFLFFLFCRFPNV